MQLNGIKSIVQSYLADESAQGIYVIPDDVNHGAVSGMTVLSSCLETRQLRRPSTVLEEMPLACQRQRRQRPRSAVEKLCKAFVIAYKGLRPHRANVEPLRRTVSAESASHQSKLRIAVVI